MTNFEKIKNMNTDELAIWLAAYGDINEGPWDRWFDYKYCRNCPSIIVESEKYGTHDCSFCEFNHFCKFFPEITDQNSSTKIIKLWLEAENKDFSVKTIDKTGDL